MSKYKRPLYINIDTGRWDATRPQQSNTHKHTYGPNSDLCDCGQHRPFANLKISEKLSLKSVVDWLRAFFSDPLE